MISEPSTRVLIVEPNRLPADALAHTAADTVANLEVHFCNTAESALAAVAAEKFGLAFLGMQLEDLDGLDYIPELSLRERLGAS